ncbi:MAG: hypothetical protein CVV02_07955 [Firmicutes bacterium HGW-Firmicutes-7]|nr:MAG: hypothetical protein CVV02_07955 [Firmicutes bacterium HGW-Firmicutes-7]
MHINSFVVMLENKALMDLLEKIITLGPIAGILLVMTEAFIPVLPLSVFVAINVMVYGFWQGYLYSWIGNVLASILLFLIIRKYGTSKFKKKIQSNRKINNIFVWIQQHGFMPIFILLSFPFTPSFLVCGLSALAGVKCKTFIYSIIFGKLIMILSLSFIGYNVSEFLNQPIKSVILITLTLSISFVAKIIMGRFETKLDAIVTDEEINLDEEKKIA